MTFPFPTEIKKFLYSQYFYGGLRIAVGISLPAVLMLLIFHHREIGFTISTGALCTCAADRPEPLKYKHNDMLACALLGFLSALTTGIASLNPVTLWSTVVPLTFVLSMLVVYGFQWPQISFGSLFVMALTMKERFTLNGALVNALWILVGGLWYTYWSTLVSRWQSHRLEQQAIAEGMFATADYLRARAKFYELTHDLDECYRQLITKQVAAVNLQNAARDIALRRLPELRAGRLDVYRTKLFNLFINIVDLHEMIVATHTDYALMRAVFAQSDIMFFFRDLIHKCAYDLEEVGLAVLQNRSAPQHVRIKAELRAIEYEIEIMRKKHFPVDHSEAYAALVATYRRIWSISRLINKMRALTYTDHRAVKTEINIDQWLQRFLQHRRVPISQIFSNLTLSSPSFKHALRVTAAVAIGLWLGKLLPLTNSYWICVTCIIILKPDFSLTQQRNKQRLVGTVIGCIASMALITFVKSLSILLLVMFICMVMSYSFLLLHYTASVVFTSGYVLILHYLLMPISMRIIGERALDTAIGCAITIAMSYLLPSWEYRVIGPLVKNVISSMRQYFKAVCQLEGDFHYRLARKNMHIAFANLGNAFSRMMLEPKSQQKFVAELNNLLIQSHVLAAQITAVAPLIASVNALALVNVLDKPTLSRALAIVDHNLGKAQASIEAGLASSHAKTKTNALVSPSNRSSDPMDNIKAVTRALDSMVVDAQQTPISPREKLHELRLLAHQCKQMIATSQLIRKDACVIQLPVK